MIFRWMSAPDDSLIPNSLEAVSGSVAAAMTAPSVVSAKWRAYSRHLPLHPQCNSLPADGQLKRDSGLLHFCNRRMTSQTSCRAASYLAPGLPRYSATSDLKLS